MVGEFAAPWNWTPIGAVETATGYDIALHVPGADEYTVWSTDSSGYYLSNLVGAVSGTSAALESFESIFNQDLNGDGVIGLYAAPSSTLQVNTATTAAATIGAGATLKLDLMDSGSVTFAASTGMLKLDASSAFSGEIFNFNGNGALAGSNQIDIANINYNSSHDTYSDGVLTVTDGTNTNQLHFNGSYVLVNFSFASDGSGGTIVYDPPVPTSATVDASIDPSPGTNKAQSYVTKAPSSGSSEVIVHHDSFLFPPNLGNDAQIHSASNIDRPALEHAELANIADLLAAAHEARIADPAAASLCMPHSAGIDQAHQSHLLIG